MVSINRITFLKISWGNFFLILKPKNCISTAGKAKHKLMIKSLNIIGWYIKNILYIGARHAKIVKEINSLNSSFDSFKLTKYTAIYGPTSVVIPPIIPQKNP